ncbi:hypothetical protein BGP75_08950 [Motiliproteus sp. MSK22-1]|nr:hypothetical protein BGP75_08950 [Motiliproteus sp. MSK22-1]
MRLCFRLILFSLILFPLAVKAEYKNPGAETRSLESVTLQLKWRHQFQFSGYYAAIEQGFYREAGLTVRLLEHQQDRAPAQVLLDGDADYAVTGSDILIRRSSGAPLVALAAIFQHSAYALLVRADAGIKSVQDLAGKRIMLGPGVEDAALHAMLRRGGLTDNDFQRQASSFDAKDLLRNNTDAFNAYVTDQGFLLQKAGVQPQYLMPRLYGVDFYGDILATTEKEIKNNPDRVARFRKATLKGWAYALSNPDEMVDLIQTKYSSQGMSRDHLLYEAQASRELIQPLLVQIGHMNPDRWQHIKDIFVELQLVEPDSSIEGLAYEEQSSAPEWVLWTAQHLVRLLLVIVAIVALLLLSMVLQMRRIINQRTAELADSERRYRTIFNAAPEGMWVVDPDLNTLDVNKRLTSLLGYSREEMLGKKPMVFTDESNEKIFSAQTAKIPFTDHRRYDIELQHRDGHNISTHISAVTVRKEDSSTMAAIAFVEDVTARKAMEASLRRSEKNLRALIDAEPACVKTLDRDCRVLSMNAAGLRMVEAEGFAQVGGSVVSNLVDEEYRQDFVDLNNDVFAGKSRTLTFSLTGLKGRKIWMETHAVPIFSSEGEVVRQLSVTQDVTRRRFMEQQVKEESEFLQGVIDGISDSVLVVNPDYSIRLMNQTVKSNLRGLGIDPEKLRHYPDLPYIFDDLDLNDLNLDGLNGLDVEGEGFDGENDDNSPVRAVLKTGRQATGVASYQLSEHLDGVKRIEIIASPLLNSDGSIRGVIEVARDVTDHLALLDEVKQQKDHLQHLAHHDSLTNLPNRVLFLDRLELAISKAHRSGFQVAVLFVDLDRFKEINDTLGHAFGDRVLKDASRRFRNCIREDDTVARLGGDEFTFISETLNDPRHAAFVAQKLIQSLEAPFIIDNHPFFLTASIGISLYPQDGESAQTLLRNADAAMYKAKDEGRNTFHFYTENMTEQAFERMFLETSLRQGLQNSELVVYYQLQVNAVTGQTTGMEALVRWQHPELGLVPPDKFIPLAEETGLIIPLGEQVMATACKQMVEWRRQKLFSGKVAVNLSVKQISSEALLTTLKATLLKTGCKAEWLELEVTEGFLMKDPEKSIDIMNSIRALGVELAIDDFGIGYSSLAYLKRFPVTRLKIDRSFVRDVPKDPDDNAITRAVIALGRSLNLNVIAEGVETEEQKEFLIEEGCEEVQGYLFSRPVVATDMTEILRSW